MRCRSCGRDNPADSSFCAACGSPLDAPLAARAGNPPRQLAGGRYELRAFLGEGGRKRVHLAHDTALDRDVAVATVKTEGLDEGGRSRVRREAQAMARLGDHPHIVTVHDIGEEDGEPYIVSQYMAGGALSDLLDGAPGRRLDLDTVLAIASAVTRALEHAHENGIVHRDLKPENVWLGADGTAKLGDFGLAFSVEHARAAATGAIVGTAAYMAPEQALGHRPDAQSDLYSLGAMLYEMVSGRPPFLGDDAIAVISQHTGAEPMPPSRHSPDVPDELERLILDLLAKAPEERPQGAREVSARLAAIEAAGAATGEELELGDDGGPVDGLAAGVFVGREQEVERLRAALEDALHGRGRLVMLVGEPGIGKTRTAEQLVGYARMRGARVFTGRSYESEGEPAYWPWVQMARALVADSDPDELRDAMGEGAPELVRLMPALRDLMPEVEERRLVEPEQARFRFFDAVTTFLRNVAARRPLVLVLDDLHWADGPSLRLLQFLARELSDTSILVLGTYRDVELGRRHPLSQALGDLSRQGLVERVTLRGLAEDEVRRFIAVTASIDPPPSLVRSIHEQTEGNPFFVSELVNLFAAESQLDDPAGIGQWTLTIPQGVREVLGRRLDRLSEDCNRALAVASVIGREFPVELLARVADLSRDRLLELLEEAEAERIVEAAPPSGVRFSFSHALVREALYEELGVTQRVRLHRRTAEAIEEISGPDRAPHLEELAHHFLQAQDLDRAIEYSEAAAERAVRVMAFEGAADLYAKALQALELRDPSPTRRYVELLAALGVAQSRAADGRGARRTFERAAAIARDLGERELFAASVLGLATWIEIGNPEHKITEMIEEALRALDDADSALRARLLVRLSVSVYFTRPGERARLARAAVAMARRIGEPDTLAAVLEHAHFTLSSPAEVEERLVIATELIEAAEQAGDHPTAIEGHGMRLVDLLEMGDIEGVDREMPVYSRGAATLREPNYLRYATLRRAMRLLLAGRFAAVEPMLAHYAPEHARHELVPNTVQAFGVVRFALRRFQGRIDEVGDSLSRFADQYPAVPAWRSGVALLHAVAGRHDRARAELDGLIGRGVEEIPLDANWVVTVANVAETAARVGAREYAPALYDALLPFAHRNVIVGGGWVCYGSISRYLGLLATTLERYADAERHFGDALAMNERLKAPPLAAQTRTDFASMLIRRGWPGDAARAGGLVGEALRTSEELGMRSLVERALGLRLRLQGTDSADARTSIDAVASVVEEERPDLRGHTAPDGTVTILFSDIERSTEINERLGDRRWVELLHEHNAIVRAGVRVHGGFEVKSQGDGFMVVFSSPRSAVDCAVDVQRALAEHVAAGGEPIRVRMGLHTGEAIRERDDFFGRNVVVAARIAAEARGGEVLVSEPLRELAEGGDGIAFSAARDLELKGLQGSYRVHAVEWDLERAGAKA